MFIEICIDSIESALSAKRGGADRIELCSHLQAGGLTPSYGLMKEIKSRIKLPVHVMIRPRPGDFLYSDYEFKVMKTDVEMVKEMGFAGIVFGILTREGHPDIVRIKEIVNLAKPMKTVFHRAFDVCADPLNSLADLIGCKIDILLTSGQKDKAPDGVILIAELIKKAEKRIQILVGSGITADNILMVAEKTRATNFHLSARKEIPGNMIFKNKSVQMGHAENEIQYIADENIIRKICLLKKETPD